MMARALGLAAAAGIEQTDIERLEFQASMDLPELFAL
jgi:hypothetical protein